MNETRIRKGTIMKRTTALALLGLACLMAMPSIAHARYRDGMNLYQYVESSPVGRIDPSGTRWVDYDPGTGFRGYAPGNPNLTSGSYSTAAPRITGDAKTGKAKDDTAKGKNDGQHNPPDIQNPPNAVWVKAHFLHSVGTYQHAGIKVGHTGIGCEDKNGQITVFDYVGGKKYQDQTFDAWKRSQSRECDKGCEWGLEDLVLKLTAAEANRFCHRLKGRNNLKWDPKWEGRGNPHGDNCNSSVCYDMGQTTSIDVPEEKASFWWGLVTEAAYYNRWGKFTAPWLRRNGHVSSESTSKHKCTGGGVGAGGGGGK